MGTDQQEAPAWAQAAREAAAEQRQLDAIARRFMFDIVVHHIGTRPELDPPHLPLHSTDRQKLAATLTAVAEHHGIDLAAAADLIHNETIR